MSNFKSVLLDYHYFVVGGGKFKNQFRRFEEDCGKFKKTGTVLHHETFSEFSMLWKMLWSLCLGFKISFGRKE